MLKVTTPLVVLLAPSACCFNEPVHATFSLLVVAWIACLGRRTLSRVWQTTGRAADADHSKPYRAQSKYSSEKPDESTPVKIGTEGYTSAGSLLFFVDPYYTQIVSTTDDPKFSEMRTEDRAFFARRFRHDNPIDKSGAST